MKQKILIWIIVALVLTASVSALGIRPAKTTVKPYYNVPQSFSFKIVNNDHKEMDVRIYAEGDFANRIKFKEKILHFTENEEMKQFNFEIMLPHNIPPGSHEIHIIAEEELPNMSISGNTFIAKLKIVHKVYIDIPYPDKYVRADVSYEEDEKSIKFAVNAQNVGSKDVANAESTIGIYENDEEITKTETDKKSIKQGESKVLNAEIDRKDVGEGEFNLVAKIFFDEEILELTKTMIIGKPDIEIVNFDKFFEMGKVNKLDIDLKSDWNKDLNSSYIEVFVFKGDKEIARIKSVTFDMAAKESRRITTYLDAKDINLGEYDATIVAYYGAYSTTEKAKINIVSAEEYEKLGRKTGWIYMVAVLVVVIAVLIVLVLGLVRKNKTKAANF